MFANCDGCGKTHFEDEDNIKIIDLAAMIAAVKKGYHPQTILKMFKVVEKPKVSLEVATGFHISQIGTRDWKLCFKCIEEVESFLAT